MGFHLSWVHLRSSVCRHILSYEFINFNVPSNQTWMILFAFMANIVLYTLCCDPILFTISPKNTNSLEHMLLMLVCRGSVSNECGYCHTHKHANKRKHTSVLLHDHKMCSPSASLLRAAHNVLRLTRSLLNFSSSLHRHLRKYSSSFYSGETMMSLLPLYVVIIDSIVCTHSSCLWPNKDIQI